MRSRGKLPTFSTTTVADVTADVDVEIDGDDLRDAGWHHESECGGRPLVTGLGTAIVSLHRQAHPSQHRDVLFCREEPCRSLLINQLDEVSP